MRRVSYRPRLPGNAIKRLAAGLAMAGRLSCRQPGIALRALNVPRFGLEAASFRLIFAASALSEGRRDYDIIHCHFMHNGILGAALRDIGAMHGKVLTSFHGYDVHKFPLEHGRGVCQHLFKNGDAFTANTTFTARKAADLGCPSHKIAILPEGLAVSHFPFRVRQPSDNGIRLLTVGRLVEKKGYDISIRAFAQVAAGRTDLHYSIIGDGPLRPALQTLIDSLKVSDKVQLLGWRTQEQVRQIYDDSHLFMLASKTSADGDMEGQGLVLQEAQAMGLPVLSTLHNGIPDGVLDGQSGFLVPENEVTAMAERLAFAVEHPQKWPEWGTAGRRFVESRYDTVLLTKRLVEIYRGM
jgi:colanic acid/amylovoran biosynthesis glycosyltransferase